MKKNLVTLLSEKAYLMDHPEHESTEWVVHWFDVLRQCVQNDDPLAVKAGNHKLMLVPYLFDLLRECFLTHRWQDGLKILIELADVSSGTATTIWKAGLQLLYYSPEANDHLISQLVGQMKLLSDLNAKEVVLEYVMFLLHTGQLDNSKIVFQSIPRYKGIKKQSTEKSLYVDTLFQAYQGLIWYVEWLQVKQTMDSMEKIMEETEYYQSQWSSLNHEQVLDSHATKALAFFSNIYKEIGVWDIFITKHVELLEFFERLDEARHILEEYRDRNKENPNAHKYLYRFSHKYGMEAEDEIKHLKAIADCVPSDSLVLKLVEILWKDKHPSAVVYLINLLDYSCWRAELKPWELLSALLTEVCSRCDEKECHSVKTCWKLRASWWPIYHFKDNTSVGNPNSQTLSLNFHKAVAAIFLLGRDNPFTMAVRKNLDIERQEELDKYKKQCPTIGIT